MFNYPFFAGSENRIKLVLKIYPTGEKTTFDVLISKGKGKSAEHLKLEYVRGGSCILLIITALMSGRSVKCHRVRSGLLLGRVVTQPELCVQPERAEHHRRCE